MYFANVDVYFPNDDDDNDDEDEDDSGYLHTLYTSVFVIK